MTGSLIAALASVQSRYSPAAAPPPATAGGLAATMLGAGEGTVILAWPGYVEDGSNDPAVDWVTRSRQTGCEVTPRSTAPPTRRS